MPPGLLVETLRGHARVRPERPALSFVDFDGDGSTTTWSYGELDRRARGVATALRRHAGSGDHVAIQCPHGLEYALAILGCLYAGVCAIPLPPPAFPQASDRLSALLAEVVPACVVTTATAVPDAARVSKGLVDLVAIDKIDSWPVEPWSPPRAIDEHTVAYLLYTSGSTGTLRGVAVTHANLSHAAVQCGQAFGVLPGSVSVTWLPFHDMGLAAGIIVPLSLGMHSVVMTPFAFVRHPLRWLRLISDYRASFTAAPNFALDLCVDRADADDLSGMDLSSLDALINGAEPPRLKSLRRFSERFASHGFTPRAHKPTYGLAETTLLVTATPVGESPRVLDIDRAAAATGLVVPVDTGHQVRRLVGCGVPAGQNIAIVDPTSATEPGPGHIGEVWVHGPTVVSGYHGQAEQTWETFHNRLHDDRNWLRTGDLGFQHEEHLYLVGRHEGLIVVSGRDHHPIDIETTVEATHASLRPGHVVAFSVEVADAERLVVVAETDSEVLSGGEQHQARLRLAVRKTIAAVHGLDLYEFLLVRKGLVPMTSSGGPRRGTARQRYRDGAYHTVAQRS